MTAFIENIRKMMSWCPNASIITNNKIMQFNESAATAPDGGRYPAGAASGWWSRYRNRRLLLSVAATFFAIALFFQGGIYKIAIFLAGFFTGTICGILELQFGLKALDKQALSGRINYSKKTKVVIIATLILSPVLFWYSGHTFGREETLAFTSGFFLIIWIKFFEIVYWEKKNGKILMLDKTGFYAVDDSK
ncbi:MAG TPA: DUF1673 family protein [Candidatus Methanoperedens sp.]